MKNTTKATKLAGLKALTQGRTQERIIEVNASATARAFAKMTLTGNLGVGQVTNMGLICNLLSLHAKKAAKALMDMFELDSMDVAANKGVEYKGLSAVVANTLEIDAKKNPGVKYDTYDKEVLVTVVSNKVVDALLNEMKSCDLFDAANIEKIFKDVDALYRMYQELIIDAAKKVYIVKIRFVIEDFRAMCLQKYSKDYDYDKNEFTFSKNFPERYEFFKDDLHVMQESSMGYLKDVLTVIREAGVGMPQEEIERLLSYRGVGPADALVQIIKYAYGVITQERRSLLEEYYSADEDVVSMTTGGDEEDDAVKEIKALYKEKLEMLKNLTRQLLSGYSDEEKASMIQLAAKTIGGTLDPKSSNMMATSLLSEEFLTMVKDTSAQVKVMGYKLLKNNGLTAGDKVEFVNGASADGSLLDFKDELVFASGEFEIQEFRGALYAVKPLEFKAPEADMTKRLFFVKNGKAFDKNFDKICKALKENAIVSVDEFGDIIVDGKVVAEAKTTEEKELDALLSVKGWISHVSIIDREDKAPFVMFELSDVVELERESIEEDEIDESDLFDEELDMDDLADIEEDEEDDIPEIDDILDEEFDI